MDKDLPYDPMIQNGRTCVICGNKDYPLSCGGSDICPSCDCGNTIRIGKNLYKRVFKP